MLLINDLSKTFGGIKALKNLKLEVHAGEVVGLIGPNGSGKTTTINLVTGIYTSDAGSVILDGKPVTNHAADKITKAGMARTIISTLSPFIPINQAAVGFSSTDRTAMPLLVYLSHQCRVAIIIKATIKIIK